MAGTTATPYKQHMQYAAAACYINISFWSFRSSWTDLHSLVSRGHCCSVTRALGTCSPFSLWGSPIAPGAEPHREATERKSQLIRYSDRLSWLNLLQSTWTGGEGHKILNDTRKLLSALSWFFGRHSEQLVVHPFVAQLFHSSKQYMEYIYIYTHKSVGCKGFADNRARRTFRATMPSAGPNSPWKHNRKNSYDATNQIKCKQCVLKKKAEASQWEQGS